jgi:hypothetical protein
MKDTTAVCGNADKHDMHEHHEMHTKLEHALQSMVTEHKKLLGHLKIKYCVSGKSGHTRGKYTVKI